MYSELLFNSSLFVACGYLLYEGMSTSSKQYMFAKFIRLKHYIFGDPYAPKPAKLIAVDAYPDSDNSNICDLYHETVLGFDLTEVAKNRFDFQTPVTGADFGTVWKMLVNGIPELEENPGRIEVTCTDKWGNVIHRLFRHYDVVLPFETLDAPSMTSSALVHVGISVTQFTSSDDDDELDPVILYTDIKNTTKIFKSWFKNRKEFSPAVCRLALRDYLEIFPAVVKIFEMKKSVDISIQMTFSDLSTMKHHERVNWNIIDLSLDG